jgi:hypothetical protein
MYNTSRVKKMGVGSSGDQRVKRKKKTRRGLREEVDSQKKKKKKTNKPCLLT